MAKSRHPNELVSRTMVITKDQSAWLEERNEATGLGASYFVRAALDHYRDHPAAKLLHERTVTEPQDEAVPA